MRFLDLSTPAPRLAIGEPACSDLRALGANARAAILSAHLGTLRRAGSHWYGPNKRAPIPGHAIRALIARRLLYSPDHNTARITKRGQWCARTLGSEIDGGACHHASEELAA